MMLKIYEPTGLVNIFWGHKAKILMCAQNALQSNDLKNILFI